MSEKWEGNEWETIEEWVRNEWETIEKWVRYERKMRRSGMGWDFVYLGFLLNYFPLVLAIIPLDNVYNIVRYTIHKKNVLEECSWESYETFYYEQW